MTPSASPYFAPARKLATQWRADPSDRARIERLIKIAGREAEFTRAPNGDLRAKMTPEIRAQILGASGGYMGTSDDRRFWAEMKDPAIVSAAGMGFVRESHTGLIHLGEAA
jgi:hypothetical protein